MSYNSAPHGFANIVCYTSSNRKRSSFQLVKGYTDAKTNGFFKYVNGELMHSCFDWLCAYNSKTKLRVPHSSYVNDLYQLHINYINFLKIAHTSSSITSKH